MYTKNDSTECQIIKTQHKLLSPYISIVNENNNIISGHNVPLSLLPFDIKSIIAQVFVMNSLKHDIVMKVSLGLGAVGL